MWQNVEYQKLFKYYDQKTISTLLELQEISFSFTEYHRNHQTESPIVRCLSVAAHQMDDKRSFNVRLESRGFTKRLEQRESH
jgi:hypothetical protein